MLGILAELNRKKPIWVELGLQTSDDRTAKSFGRGYETCEYIKAVSNLKKVGSEVITHIIFGLPGESKEGMLRSVRTAIDAGTDGVKFTCLYILKGTRYEKEWEEGRIEVLSMEEYFDIVEQAINMLPSHVVVHRLTGDGPKSLLLAPMWTANKRNVINYINKRFS